MVLMLDDFHNIHTRHTPANLLTNNVVHMASCLVDIHPTITAVPPAQTLHRRVTVNVDGHEYVCLGGIKVSLIQHTMTTTLAHMQHQFLDQLPTYLQNIDPGRLQAALRELRLIYFTVTHYQKQNQICCTTNLF